MGIEAEIAILYPVSENPPINLLSADFGLHS